MPVIFQTLMQVILSLVRQCPKCGQKQMVPPAKRNEPVPCKHCGARVPPPG